MNTEDRGFTLIELMVSISIMALLASLIFTSVSGARARARDLRAIDDLVSIKTALALYKSKFGVYPNDGANVGSSPYTDNFADMVQQLITDGDLDKAPISPLNHPYSYYNYGPGNTKGALLRTTLENVSASTQGPYSSYRYNWPGNWCDSSVANSDYCLNNPY